MKETNRYGRAFSPLALASYAAWGAVWVSNSRWLGSSPGPGWWADAFLLGVLASWVVFLVIENEAPGWQLDGLMLILAICVLGLIGLGRSGTSPILLVLLASQFASRYSFVPTLVLFVSINLIFVILMQAFWHQDTFSLAISAAAYVAFQLFAVLLLRYARQAERMSTELRLVNADLLATRSLLDESARDQERLRLSRELHDVAGHKLTALRMNLRSLRSRSERQQCPELVQADALAAELLDELRAVVRQLRKNDGISLEAGFRQLAAPMASLRLEMDIEPGARAGRMEQAECLFRVVQEGLTNAARHGRASRAWLHMGRVDDELVLQLEDNGKLQWPLEPGVGLLGMQERLEAIDGRLELAPSTRGGLCLRAVMPMELLV